MDYKGVNMKPEKEEKKEEKQIKSNPVPTGAQIPRKPKREKGGK